MSVHEYAPERLSRKDCLLLLSSVGLGRLAFSERALPAIVAVRFAVEDESLVFRVEPSAAWTTSQRHAVVAFEAGLGDPLAADSWTVSAVGRLDPVTAPRDVDSLHAMPSWATLPPYDAAYLRLEPQLLEGTRNSALGL